MVTKNFRYVLPLIVGSLLAFPIRSQTSFTELTVDLPGGPSYDGSVVKSLDPGDFDGDGDFDLIILQAYHSDENPSADSTALMVYLNDGPNGTDEWIFTPLEIPLDGLGNWQSDLAWGDYDGDGDLDAAVVSDTGGALPRNEEGTLVVTDTEIPLYDEGVPYVLYDTHFDRRTLTWADFDNDGDLDLLMPGSVVNGDHVTSLLRNVGPVTPDWVFTLVTDLLPPTTGAQTTWADNDDDGDLDLLVHNPKTQALSPSIDPFTTIFRNDDSSFSDVGFTEIPIQQGTSDWADYDGDGDLDILLSGLTENFDHVVWIHRNDGGVYTQVVLLDGVSGPD